MSEPNNIVIYGRDYEAANEIHCQVIGDLRIGFGMSVGTTPKANEDCLGVSTLKDDVLLAIADGHWGKRASELAIQKAMDMLRTTNPPPQENEIRARFYALFEQVNRELFEIAMANPGASAPETTLIVCQLKDIFADKYLYWSSFGDSFLFVLRRGEIIQLNSLNAYWLGMLSRLSESSQTRQLVLKGLFGESRYVGVAEGLETGIEIMQPGDVIVLCTDGLIGSDEEMPELVRQKIQSIFSTVAPLENKINELIKSALDRGEKDNVACIVVQVD
jgi:serine/threonine protein phosphatase PrpC